MRRIEHDGEKNLAITDRAGFRLPTITSIHQFIHNTKLQTKIEVCRVFDVKRQRETSRHGNW